MAFTQMSPSHKDTVHALLEGKQYMMGRHTCGTHHPDGSDIRRVLQSTDPSQVSGSVCSPRTQETQNFGFEIGIVHDNSLYLTVQGSRFTV